MESDGAPRLPLFASRKNRGLVLADIGFGIRNIESPYSRLIPFFINLNRIQFDRKYTAVDRIQQLGFPPRNVRHIVLTHLDFDRAGGKRGFPKSDGARKAVPDGGRATPLPLHRAGALPRATVGGFKIFLATHHTTSNGDE